MEILSCILILIGGIALGATIERGFSTFTVCKWKKLKDTLPKLKYEEWHLRSCNNSKTKNDISNYCDECGRKIKEI